MTIRIRLARDGDVDAMAAIYRPVAESTAISFETTAPDSAEMARRVHETLPSHPWLVCEVDGRLAGYAYATKHRVRAAYQWSVDTSIYVAVGHQRLGVGRGLYASLLAILTAQGYANAYAGIALPNPASVALHEAMGFEPVGVYRSAGYKLGRWWDVGWWQRSLRDREGTPEPPKDLAALEGRVEWEGWLRRGEPMVRGR
jgi:phosphinothricin acetyltransferase